MVKSIEVVAYKVVSNSCSILLHEASDEAVTYSIVSDKVHKTPTQVKVYYNMNGEAYFYMRRQRHYLHEYMRTNYMTRNTWTLHYDTKTKEVVSEV